MFQESNLGLIFLGVSSVLIILFYLVCWYIFKRIFKKKTKEFCCRHSALDTVRNPDNYNITYRDSDGNPCEKPKEKPLVASLYDSEAYAIDNIEEFEEEALVIIGYMKEKKIKTHRYYGYHRNYRIGVNVDHIIYKSGEDVTVTDETGIKRLNIDLTQTFIIVDSVLMDCDQLLKDHIRKWEE